MVKKSMKEKVEETVMEGMQSKVDKDTKATENFTEVESASYDEVSEAVLLNEQVQKLSSELGEAKDKYLRLYSEFENFRRRTTKERIDLIKTANQDLMVALLPVVDDFERAQKALDQTEDHKTSKEGFELIYNKFNNILKQKGLKTMEVAAGAEFDTEFHEAISQMPSADGSMKGKIIDVVEKGYLLEDKVVRFAKVVTGA
jgi:molecular chaperone GrpE